MHALIALVTTLVLGLSTLTSPAPAPAAAVANTAAWAAADCDDCSALCRWICRLLCGDCAPCPPAPCCPPACCKRGA